VTRNHASLSPLPRRCGAGRSAYINWIQCDRHPGGNHGGRLCYFLPSVLWFHQQPSQPCTDSSCECAMTLSSVSHGWWRCLGPYQLLQPP
jgi:hypothetical protein